MKLRMCVAAAVLVNAIAGKAQEPVTRAISVFAGREDAAPGPAFGITFNTPFGIAHDGLPRDEKSYFAVELDGGRVFQFPQIEAGRPRHIAGTGGKGYAGDGLAPIQATFDGMHNLAVDGQTIYIADTWNHCIRKIDLQQNEISTVAGTGEPGFAGDGGPASRAMFNYVMCITLNPQKDKLYIADLRNHRIRMLDLNSNVVTTVAGNGEKGIPADGGLAKESPLVDPRAVTVDASGNIYILERGGHALRVVDPSGTIKTVAGTGQAGFRDGQATQAQFNSPKHLCIGSSQERGEHQIFIADDMNRAIRQYDPVSGGVSTVLGRGQGDARIMLNRPHGVSFTSGSLFVVDSGNHRILKLDMFDGPPRYVVRRSNFFNSARKFEDKLVGHVAFMGGSITEMNGYRPMVCAALRQQHPQTEFLFTNAGISSTCSTTGAFRLTTDVLEKGPVDLFFIEFAVNDDQDAGHSARQCLRGMEGILRQCIRHNPKMDIVVTYFVNPGMLEEIRGGKVPVSIANHEKVAAHYGITTVNLAAEVAERIEAQQLTWQEYGGTHPADRGNRICAAMIHRLLHLDPNQSTHATRTHYPDELELKTPIDENSFDEGRFLSTQHIELGEGFGRKIPNWASIAGNCRARFRDTEMLCADQAGAELTIRFQGRSVGAYVLAGPDAGIMEASVDGGPYRKLDLYHRFSKGLHYPRTVMLADDLERSNHTVRVRVSVDRNEASNGNAVRILEIVAN